MKSKKIKIWVALTIILVIIFCSIGLFNAKVFSIIGGDNLIKNPSFEEVNPIDASSPMNWYKSGADINHLLGFDANPHTGLVSIKSEVLNSEKTWFSLDYVPNTIIDFNTAKSELINYLHLLEGNHVIIGQASYPMLHGAVNTGWREFDQVKNISGKELGILNMDYYRGTNISCYNYVAESNSYMIEWNSKGGINMLSLHMINPFNKQKASNTSNVNMQELLTLGSVSNANLNSELDCIASGLKQLQDKGIIVMIRPYHEMNGNWFWWGSRDSTQFKALWEYTYNYLVVRNNLQNLLFVYGPNANTGNYLTYYDANYVDIVSLDMYKSDPVNNFAGGYNELTSLGKPFGFAEYSPYKANPPLETEVFDSRIWTNAVKSTYPKTSFLISYAWDWSLPRQSNLQEMMSDPYVFTLDNVNNRLLIPKFIPVSLDSYVVQYWYKNENLNPGQIGIGIKEYDAYYQETSTNDAYLTNVSGKDWKEFIYQWLPQSDKTKYVTLSLYNYNINGKLWFDDVNFRQGKYIPGNSKKKQTFYIVIIVLIISYITYRRLK